MHNTTKKEKNNKRSAHLSVGRSLRLSVCIFMTHKWQQFMLRKCCSFVFHISFNQIMIHNLHYIFGTSTSAATTTTTKHPTTYADESVMIMLSL